ncbi:MMPL family transporter [Phycicoccus sp. CSK15P-2]|uniref:MMPL family transporter n=1 Tax=Phycicoccus sp. CSK15P-2 TaxID=2807627 RepID=UPI0019529AE0|nr:MMPL family transporter [Phycicoccus sp. CSK15P-2]MBM6403570.1 MMPL family transporter [Phycicoccus sp. CSK15P-2]
MSRHPVSAVPIRAARWSATHPWWAICGWLVLVAVSVALAATVSTRDTQEADHRVGESGRADAMVEQAGLASPPSENVLVTAPEGDVGTAAAPAVRVLAERLRSVEGVVAVGDPLPAADGRSLLVPVELVSRDVEPGPLLAATAAVQAGHPDLTIRQAGDITIGAAIDERVAADLRSAELRSLPVTLLLMVLTFGALVAAGLPVLLAATSVAATIGIMAPISHVVPAEPTVYSMIVLIGMAVGVDYSLFYLTRERQERAAGRTRLDAVTIAAETSGHAVLVSGGAVVSALAGLFVLTDATFDSLATGAIIVVAVAVLGSVTVLPALLSALGRWVDRPRVPLLWRLARRVPTGSVGRTVLGPVVRHPVAALVVSMAAVAALAVPAVTMRTQQPSLETLPPDLAPVRTAHDIARAFPSEGSTTRVVLAGARPDEASAALRGLAADAAPVLGVPGGNGTVRTSEDGSAAVVELPIAWDGGDDRAQDAVRELRTELVPAALAGLEGEDVTWAVGGDAAEDLDYSDRQGGRMPLLLGIVLALTMLMMMAAFRSAVLGVVSTVLNLASVGVAFGVLSLVFQHGLGQDLLGVRSPGFVVVWIPVLVLVVLVGLSMDYHVFVLSRVRELVEAGQPVRAAVHRGIADTAGVITSAAAVMVSVFALFATLSMTEMQMLGVGLAVGVLVDATVIRLVMLPALLVLLGERAWPTRRRRRPVAVEAPTQWRSDAGTLVPVAAGATDGPLPDRADPAYPGTTRRRPRGAERT